LLRLANALGAKKFDQEKERMTDLALTMQGAVRRIDRVWLAIAAVFLILLAFRPEQALVSASFVFDAFSWILPFLLA
jgi:hypothetical protein